eukprot:s2085_g20.t1
MRLDTTVARSGKPRGLATESGSLPPRRMYKDAQKDQTEEKPAGTILVFLPGWGDIVPSRKGSPSSTTERPLPKRAKLGRTSGVIAVGAWAARLEIARMLQEGVPGEDLVKLIQKGEEGDEPLEQMPEGFGSDSGRDPPSLESTPKTSEASVAQESKAKRGESRPDDRRPGSTRAEPSPMTPSIINRDGAPTWASSMGFATKFNKEASKPVDKEEGLPSPTSPVSALGDAPPVVEGGPAGTTSVHPQEPGFRKKAIPRPPSPPQRDRSPPPIQRRRPVRHNPLDIEKLASFKDLCLKIFEELVILQVDMDLISHVTTDDGNGVDEERFHLFTEPRSPGTGLRYARLLHKYVIKVAASRVPGVEKTNPFGIKEIQDTILTMISEEVGYMTPLSFIYAVEHFGALFGFVSPGSKHPRCRKFALDYSKRAPEKNQAPPFSVPLLDYLERAVLDESKDISFRLALGKLRLCTQASVRHSDLASTALSRVEWCRMVGGTKVLGLRAKAGKTKSGPRPWAASWLAVNPANDRWLFVLSDILIKVHGEHWLDHGFLGCAGDGKGSFAASPPCIGEDITLVKQALMADLENGRPVPLSEEEIKTLRWHSCKSTLPTLMVHMGIKTRSIRYQGAWRKASESMVDLYLREAQVLVIKAQMEVLDQIRRGVTLNVLEGRPLDKIPGASCWEHPQDMFKEGVPAGIPVDQAVRAMDAAVVCVASKEGTEPQIRGAKCLSPEEVPDVFKDSVLADGERLKRKASEEATVKAACMLELNKKIDLESLTTDSETGEDSDDSEVPPDAEDMDLLPSFVTAASGKGRVHRPGPSVLGTAAGHGPACGVKGKHFAVLSLSENWGDYTLCERCFGKPSGCKRLCGYEVYKNGEYLRCARRCSPESMLDHTEDLAVSAHRCALHSELVDE